MSTYFAGGSLGTLLSGAAWSLYGWTGVVAAGILLSSASLLVTLCTKNSGPFRLRAMSACGGLSRKQRVL